MRRILRTGVATVLVATLVGVGACDSDRVTRPSPLRAARVTERGATRADDRISEAGMEDRKKEGYF